MKISPPPNPRDVSEAKQIWNRRRERLRNMTRPDAIGILLSGRHWGDDAVQRARVVMRETE